MVTCYLKKTCYGGNYSITGVIIKKPNVIFASFQVFCPTFSLIRMRATSKPSNPKFASSFLYRMLIYQMKFHFYFCVGCVFIDWVKSFNR